MFDDMYYDYNTTSYSTEQVCLVEQGSFALVRIVEKAIKGLGPSQPFLIFNTDLSAEEKSCLTKVEINSITEYNNYGNIKTLKGELNSFMGALGNDTKTSVCVSQLVTRLVKEVIIGSGKEAAWVSLRASTVNKEFDLPRWHTDGNFYLSELDDVQFKFVMALKGPQTLFYPLPGEMREEFDAIQNGISVPLLEDGSVDKVGFLKASEVNRKVLAKKLDINKAISAKFGQAAIFVVGTKYSAVHSEPPIREGRLFLSVVPGTKNQINELYQRWNSKNGSYK